MTDFQVLKYFHCVHKARQQRAEHAALLTVCYKLTLENVNLEGLYQDDRKYPTQCLFFPHQNVSTRLRKDNTSLDKLIS